MVKIRTEDDNYGVVCSKVENVLAAEKILLRAGCIFSQFELEGDVHIGYRVTAKAKAVIAVYCEDTQILKFHENPPFELLCPE